MHPARFALVMVVLVGLGCAQGSTDPGIGKFTCGDCGPASGGGDADILDGDDELDEGLPGDDASLDDGAPPDDAAPPDDTATSDGAPADTATSDTAPPADAGCKPPSGVTCTTIPQCGCSGTTNCDVTGVDGKTSCVAAGSKGLHQACAGLGECAKGLSCVFDVCVPFCTTTEGCASTSPSGECRAVQYQDSSSGTIKEIPGFDVCMAQCDPLNPTAVCGAGTTCIFVDSATGKRTCAKAGAGTTASSCAGSDPFVCAPGYTCVGSGDCMRFCRIGFPGDCAGGKSCLSFTDHPKIGGVEYGVCSY